MGKTQEDRLEKTLENITERQTEADGCRSELMSAGRTKTKYTDTLTTGSGTGEVNEVGEGQVR